MKIKEKCRGQIDEYGLNNVVIGVDNMLVIIYNYHIKVVQSGIIEE